MDTVFTIQAIPLKDNKDPNLDPVFNELWNWLLKNTKKYVNTKVGKEIISYYVEESFEDCGFDSDDNTVCFLFRDVAGATPVSSSAARHWFTLSFIQLFDELNKIAKLYGFELQKPEKSIEELTSQKSEILLFEAEGSLHRIYFDDKGNPGECINDVNFTSIEDLDNKLKKKALSICESKVCACPMCTKIRAGKPPVNVKQSANKLPKEPYFEKLSTALRFPHYARHLRLIKEYELPDTVSKLTSLTELNMWDCYGPISPMIGSLKTLKKLEIQTSRIEDKLPDTIGNLENLEELDIDIYWGLKEIPASITKLSKLKKLILKSNDLSKIPGNIGELSGLEELKINMWELAEIPQSVFNLKKLKKLDFFSCEKLGAYFVKFPFDNYLGLEEINLWRTETNSFPQSIMKCTKLRSLNLSETSINALPDYIGTLADLECLEISRTNITSLPDSIYTLTKIKRLSLGQTQITELNERIGALENIETLSLDETEIDHLPISIGKLKNLRLLYIGETKIMSLPESIKECKQLEKIFYDKKQAETIEKDLDKYDMSHLSDSVYYSR